MSDGTQVSGSQEAVVDVLAPRQVLGHEVLVEGRIFDLVRDEVDLDHTVVHREYVDHPGAVAVIVLDEDDRVLLLDVAGEPAQVGAARELAEEADLVAGTWHTLVDYYTTPGGNNEALRVFLARDLSPVPDDQRHVREDEERDIELRWVSLDDAAAAVLRGDVHNPSAFDGVLAAITSRAGGWTSLRPADAPWPERRQQA